MRVMTIYYMKSGNKVEHIEEITADFKGYTEHQNKWFSEKQNSDAGFQASRENSYLKIYSYKDIEAIQIVKL